MIITLSPAKVIDFKTPISIKEATMPIFEKQANELIGILNRMPIEEMASLMEINPKQTIEVYQQIQSFNLDKAPKKQAAFTYNGIAYQGLNMASFTSKDIEYAQSHLIILSGLYGALRPLDMIKPYRLEMQANLATEDKESLYTFWKDMLTGYLTERLSKDDNQWLNLMSKEYTKVIDIKRLPKNINIVSPVFKQETATGYKQIVVYTKKARGMMARFAIKNRITALEELKAFDEEGYTFASHLSKKGEWVFIR